jgi:hypothetical protein
MRRYHIDDEDDGILRDGDRLVVPMARYENPFAKAGRIYRGSES